MDQQPIIIAKNITVSAQKFLGSVIPPLDQVTISDFYFQNQITRSSELKVLINSGDIVINNGTDDLTPAEAIVLCSYPYSMLNATTSGTDNASVGTSTLENITSGDYNTAVGDYSLSALTTGSDNIAIGVQSGINYTGSESDNILLGHTGATGESGTIRIGTANQTSAYIAGIYGNSSTSTYENVMINPVDGKLATRGMGAWGQMYFNQNSERTTIIASSTWTSIEAIIGGSGGYNTTPGTEFTYSTAGNVTTMAYTGTETINIKASASVCWELADPQAGSSDNVQIAFAVDTGGGLNVITETIQDSALEDHSIVYPRNASCQGIFSLSTSDIIALQVQNLSDTSDILVVSLNVNLHTI